MVRACAAASALFLSPAAASPSAAQPGGSGPAAGAPAVRILQPPGSLPRLVASALRAPGRLLAHVSPALLRAGSARRRARSPRELPTSSGCSSLPQSPHASEGLPCRLCCCFLGPFTGGEHLNRCLCVSGKERSVPRRPFSCSQCRCLRLSLGGRRWSQELAPQLPPSEVCRPPLPGWGKCASGRLVAGALTQPPVPVRLGQVAGGLFCRVSAQPGNPAFCNAGRDWRDLPSNMEPVGRTSERASRS